MGVVKILFLSDTHLGFDLPARPRTTRRRRGPDFLANYERALEPALAGKVDAVVHGGDLLFRSKVRPSLVEMACAPLREVAESGVPVLLVPGNHERSHIPHGLLASHPKLHVFDRPRTFTLKLRDHSVAFAGFPCCRNDVRGQFTELVRATGIGKQNVDIKLLCMHQSVEGATVGVQNYVFRSGPDIVPGSTIPRGIAGVLCGHIHRAQVLTHDLHGNGLPAPVFYPGSMERTSFVEREEEKGYLLLQLAPGGGSPGGKVTSWSFMPLPARPMLVEDIWTGQSDAPGLRDQLASAVSKSPADAVLKLRIHGIPGPDELELLRAARLREAAPQTMNVSVRWMDRDDG